jgi:hypothetical protein
MIRNLGNLFFKTKKIEKPDVFIKILYPNRIRVTKKQIRIFLEVSNKSHREIENLQIGIKIPHFLYDEYRTTQNSSELYLNESLVPFEHLTRCINLRFKFFPAYSRKAIFELFLPENTDHEYDFIEYSVITFQINLKGINLITSEESIKAFMLKECMPFRNPYDNSIIEEVVEKEEICDLFLKLVRLQINESSLKGFRKHVFKGWDSHLSSAHDFGSLLLFSLRFEIFLKLILYVLKKDFKLSLNDLIREIFKVEPNGLKKTDRDFWSKQNPMMTNLRVAFKERHRNAHEAHDLSSAEIKRGIKAIMSSWLYSIKIWKTEIKERLDELENK